MGLFVPSYVSNHTPLATCYGLSNLVMYPIPSIGLVEHSHQKALKICLLTPLPYLLIAIPYLYEPIIEQLSTSREFYNHKKNTEVKMGQSLLQFM
jgi:hypothetical protein